ncbi:unnamed protein product [Malus baccata var. baccata]
MKVNSGWIREDEARIYFQQLIITVDYCHIRGVYHRDLKIECTFPTSQHINDVWSSALHFLSSFIFLLFN